MKDQNNNKKQDCLEVTMPLEVAQAALAAMNKVFMDWDVLNEKLNLTAAIFRTEKANIRANKAKKDMQHLLNAEQNKQKTLERKKRTQRLIELGALFDIANLGHHDPATLVGMLTNISTAVAPDDHKWPKWHQQGVSILLERKQAKNTKYGDSE